MTESGMELAPFLTQQSTSKGVKGNRDSKEHDHEAVDVQLEYTNEVAWIQKHIKMRKCSCYVQSENNETKDICQCGYHKEDHEQIPSSPSNQEVESPSSKLKWSFSEDTCTIPTNAFGEIEFVDFGENIGKFVRVDENTEMDTMLDLMMNVWGMEKPNLLISVTGSAKNDFNMKPHLRDVLRRGLMKAAHSTGAWIITGGTHTGVMKHIGEAVKDYDLIYINEKPVVTIGIAPWGVIHNRNTLKHEKGSGPAKYHIGCDSNTNETFLDPNHSHFILVDNGTQNNYGTEIDFRAKLERKISEMKTDVVSVPIVILVLEGGPGTLETVKKALQENTPAVIVKGSGRVADILAYAFNYAKKAEVDAKDDQGVCIKITEKQMQPNLEADIRKQMKDMNFCSDKEINDNIKRIKDCLAKSELIHIFEWDSGNGACDIDVAMFRALLKAKKNQKLDQQLKLALAWNRIDIAKSEIFTDEKKWETDILDSIMLSALEQNRVNFVQLFLDNGVNLKKFLTIKKLQLLYEKVSSRSLLMTLFNKMKCKKKNRPCNKKITLRDVGQLIQNLLGEYYDPHYISDPRYANSYVVESQDGAQSDKAKKQTADFDNPEQDLFIWSVLNTQQDMAKLFWKEGKDAIAAALVASALLYALSSQTDQEEERVQITKYASEFTDLAIEVLKECHSTDVNKTQCLLHRELSQWGKTSCVEIALNGNNKKFISQTACQDHFTSIWMGEMTKENGNLRLLICYAIPPLIPMLVQFRENEDGERVRADHSIHCSVQKSKLPHQRGKSLTASQHLPEAKDAGNGSGNETKVHNKCFNAMQKIVSFYNAPVVIFLQNVISCMVFLGLYSYILISKLEEKMSVEEIVLIAWVFTILAEEIRQVCTAASGTLKKKFLSYISIHWNSFDVITIFLFVTGMILRSMTHGQMFEAARIYLGVNLVTFFMRLLHIFSVNKQLGPYLVMIIRTVGKLGRFIVILLVFLVAYAIASHAILYPNAELSYNTFIAIIRRPYWNIYGDLMLDEIEGAGECTNVAELYRNGTYSRCPTVSGQYFVPVLTGLYMLMCHILLLNLLIAIFSYTFDEVQEEVKMHSCFQRCSRISEYKSRPLLAPPLILVVHIFLLIRVIVRKLLDRCQSAQVKGAPNIELRKFDDGLRKFEEGMSNTYNMREPADLESILSRLNQLVNKIDELQMQLQAGTVTREDVQSCSSQIGSQLEQKSNTDTEPDSTNG